MEPITQHRINPSIEQYSSHVYEGKETIRTKGKRVGQVDGKATEISIDERVSVLDDRTHFVKLTHAGIDRLNFISKPGIKILTYILNNIGYNKTEIALLPGKVSVETKENDFTVKRAIKNLIENEFIYMSNVKHYYWININLAYIGDIEEIIKEWQNQIK